MLFAGNEGKTSPDFYPSSFEEKTKLNRDKFLQILFGKATNSKPCERCAELVEVWLKTFSMVETKKGRNRKSSGFRGGNWNNNATNARVSNRNNAANTNTNRNNNYGFRASNTCFLIMNCEL